MMSFTKITSGVCSGAARPGAAVEADRANVALEGCISASLILVAILTTLQPSYVS
jgi:hypothetical protein